MPDPIAGFTSGRGAITREPRCSFFSFSVLLLAPAGGGSDFVAAEGVTVVCCVESGEGFSPVVGAEVGISESCAGADFTTTKDTEAARTTHHNAKTHTLRKISP